MPCLITIKGIWMFLWLDTVKKHVGHAHTSTLFTTNHSQRCYRSLVLQRFREWDIDDFRRCTLSECSQPRGDSNCLGVDYGWLWYNPKTLAWNRLKSGWWYTYPSEKYKFVNGKDDIPYMKWKIIHSCSKPPTRNSRSLWPMKKDKFHGHWADRFNCGFRTVPGYQYSFVVHTKKQQPREAHLKILSRCLR